MTDRLLREKEAARVLGVAPNTLAQWRFTGKVNLTYVKLGTNIRYRMGDLQDFINQGVKNMQEVR
jgi:predicted site-specific integrase-resolvase